MDRTGWGEQDQVRLAKGTCLGAVCIQPFRCPAPPSLSHVDEVGERGMELAHGRVASLGATPSYGGGTTLQITGRCWPKVSMAVTTLSHWTILDGKRFYVWCSRCWPSRACTLRAGSIQGRTSPHQGCWPGCSQGRAMQPFQGANPCLYLKGGHVMVSWSLELWAMQNMISKDI